MPHSTADQYQYQHINITKAHPTFGAEVSGVDFKKPVSPKVVEELKRAVSEFGFLACRKAGFNDARLVDLARNWGDLHKVGDAENHKYEFLEIFDVSNLENDGSVTKVGSRRHHLTLGNTGWHTDFSFNPRRIGICMLRAELLPPKSMGGGTDFADTRTAYDELPADLKQILEEGDFIAAHNAAHSRIICAPPNSEWTRDLDPEKGPFGRQAVIQTHEGSGRKNLYLANHMHHLEYRTPRSADFVPTEQQPFEKVPEPLSTEIIKKLIDHATQDKYVVQCTWDNDGEDGDMVMWDNTCTLHRAHGGTFTENGYGRDMRRATVFDQSKGAWGYNNREGPWETLGYYKN